MDIIDFVNWLAKAGGLIALIIAVLGFLFREKWKQILQRSLAKDVEKYKAELAKEQAEHAASLTPQLEAIKHNFQQKLEAYKVTLIAESEAVKAKEELKKSIALRYSEIEFERLVNLEKIVAGAVPEIGSFATMDINLKSVREPDKALKTIESLRLSFLEAKMFLSKKDRENILNLLEQLTDFTSKYVGIDTPSLSMNSQELNKLIDIQHVVHDSLITKITSLGKL